MNFSRDMLCNHAWQITCYLPLWEPSTLGGKLLQPLHQYLQPEGGLLWHVWHWQVISVHSSNFNEVLNTLATLCSSWSRYLDAYYIMVVDMTLCTLIGTLLAIVQHILSKYCPISLMPCCLAILPLTILATLMMQKHRCLDVLHWQPQGSVRGGLLDLAKLEQECRHIAGRGRWGRTGWGGLAKEHYCRVRCTGHGGVMSVVWGRSGHAAHWMCGGSVS